MNGIHPQGRSEIRQLLAAHGLRPKRALGQNFLADPNVVDRIVRQAGIDPGSRVLEVGAGTGTLTKALAATGAEVLAYEVDGSLAAVVEHVVRGLDNVTVVHADATTDDIASRLGDSEWLMVANLPYNVGTPLLLDLLQSVPQITRFVVMLQLEVAERLTAGPGSKIYGIPSVIVALHADARIAFRVPAKVFIPEPEVESAVVVLERRTPPPQAARAIEIATIAFGQRRKMLRRSLGPAIEGLPEVLEATGVDPAARPETLSPVDFVHVAEALA